MKIPYGPGSKLCVMPELAASKDKARPALSEPWLEISPDGTGTLYATDSYIAVAIPVELDAGDTPGTVPQAALKAARSRKGGLPPEVMLDSQATAVGRDGTSTVARPDLGGTPDVSRFFVDGLDDPDPNDHILSIGIDAEKLAAVSKALGASNGIRLTIALDEAGRTTLKPLRVDPLADRGHTVTDGAKGLVMPIKLAES